MIWPFNRIMSWLEWRRLDREETVIATAEYTTDYTRDGESTGLTSKHIVSFLCDGNGLRYTRVDSSNESSAKRHEHVVRDRVNWRVHGDLPTHARRVNRKGGANLSVIHGGAA